MAKYNRDDVILQAIAKEALSFLFKNMDANRIRCILLTGSVANGEGTVIKSNSSVIASDFDFVVFLDFPHFLRNRTHFRNLSQGISTKLSERGVNTHVEFVPSTSILRGGGFFMNPSIYEYEFAFESKCIFGKVPSFNKTARPTRIDALELMFTVVSDLVFSNFKNLSKTEESYIYAKRSLTVLKSILIFHGFFAETYQKRMKIAKRHASAGVIPINQDEIKTLEIFTDYKLSGSFQHLLNFFAYKKTDDFIRFQRGFLKKLTTKILYYELLNLTNRPMETNLTDNHSPQDMTSNFPKLLKDYSEHSKAWLFPRVMGIIVYLFWLLTRDRKRKELFATFVFHKQSPKVILNFLITLLFIYGCNISVTRMLRETFPWIHFNNTSAIQTMLSLWRIAEQSIKLS